MENEIMRKIYLLNLFLILILFSSCINKYGSVEIITEPKGALIYLDGENIGKKSPSTINKIPFGKHIITLKIFGYKDEDIEIELSLSNRKISINKVLTQITSTIQIESEPEGARILFDGDDINKLTPSVIENIPYGYHKISLYKAPYVPFDEEIYVDSDKKVFKFSLQKIKFKEIEKTLKILIILL
ncbi:MAG TPA: PEGA domain-containing protein [Caldisericia bacterium]|nr:PEGA domain-containing protein [Caldisericia bacterium]